MHETQSWPHAKDRQCHMHCKFKCKKKLLCDMPVSVLSLAHNIEFNASAISHTKNLHCKKRLHALHRHHLASRCTLKLPNFPAPILAYSAFAELKLQDPC